MSTDFHVQPSAPVEVAEFEGIVRRMLGEQLEREQSIELTVRSFNPRTGTYGPPATRLDLEPEVSRIRLSDRASVDLMVIQHGRQNEQSEFLIALPRRRSALAIVLAVCTAEALARLACATNINDEGLLSDLSGGLATGRLMDLLCDAQQRDVLSKARSEYLRANAR